MAEAAGLTVGALHHHEEIGLLVASLRTDAGHRLYARADQPYGYRICTARGHEGGLWSFMRPVN